MHTGLPLDGSQHAQCCGTHLHLFDEIRVAQLFWPHVVHVRDGQAVQRFADEFDVFPLNVPQHHDLRLCLQSNALVAVSLRQSACSGLKALGHSLRVLFEQVLMDW